MTTDKVEVYTTYQIARLRLRVTKWHRPPSVIATYCYPDVYDGAAYDEPAHEWRRRNLVPTIVRRPA